MSLFNLPQELYYTYKLLTRTELVKNKNYTEEELQNFENILNLSSPKEKEDLLCYNFARFLYHSNEFGFCKLIQNNKAEALILWTCGKEIVNWFGLQGIIWLKFNNGRYHISLDKNLLNDNGELLYPYKKGMVHKHVNILNHKSYGYNYNKKKYKNHKNMAPKFDNSIFPSLIQENKNKSASEFKKALDIELNKNTDVIQNEEDPEIIFFNEDDNDNKVEDSKDNIINDESKSEDNGNNIGSKDDTTNNNDESKL